METKLIPNSKKIFGLSILILVIISSSRLRIRRGKIIAELTVSTAIDQKEKTIRNITANFWNSFRLKRIDFTTNNLIQIKTNIGSQQVKSWNLLKRTNFNLSNNRQNITWTPILITLTAIWVPWTKMTTVKVKLMKQAKHHWFPGSIKMSKWPLRVVCPKRGIGVIQEVGNQVCATNK